MFPIGRDARADGNVTESFAGERVVRVAAATARYHLSLVTRLVAVLVTGKIMSENIIVMPKFAPMFSDDGIW